MNPWTTKTVLASAGIAATIYGLLYVPSLQGWGYAGYGGWHRGPSIFYWGGVSTFHDRSVRSGSRSGPGLRGGGLHGGK